MLSCNSTTISSPSIVGDDVIDTSGLSREQKSALWLYGWSFVALDAQRRAAADAT
jgi:hypothetical protein